MTKKYQGKTGRSRDKREDYEHFVEKFKPKKTTDDCYTPPEVYQAVLDYVKKTYNISDSTRVLRPFYPGGDYESEDYSGDCIVIDNPPFSILSKIYKYYLQRGTRFFLFAPHLTLFASGRTEGLTRVVTCSHITNHNGANVNTSFLTNLTPDIGIRVDGKLHKAIREAQAIKDKSTFPKYQYPSNVLTVSRLSRLIRAGRCFNIPKSSLIHCEGMDAQKYSDIT